MTNEDGRETENTKKDATRRKALRQSGFDVDWFIRQVQYLWPLPPSTDVSCSISDGLCCGASPMSSCFDAVGFALQIEHLCDSPQLSDHNSAQLRETLIRLLVAREK